MTLVPAMNLPTDGAAPSADREVIQAELARVAGVLSQVNRRDGAAR